MKYVRMTLLVLLVGLITACSSTQAPQTPSSTAVQVNLSEMNVASSRTTFAVGVPYHFTVTNAETIPHELMLMPAMTNGGMMNGMDMDQLDKMALAHVASDDLPPGATKSFDYTFTKPVSAGTLELACYLPGHYAAGMHTTISVQ